MLDALYWIRAARGLRRFFVSDKFGKRIRLPLHTPTQDAVDLPKMVQVVCRFQADELLDRLPSAYLVNPIALHPPCARDRLQQSQVALAQRPKDPCRKARILLCVTQALRPALPEKLFIVPAYFIH